MPSLLARKQQLVRDAIEQAAFELFSTRGFDETTIDDIARAAGLSRRSLFRYFPAKSDLVAAGVDRFGASLAQSISERPAAEPLPRLFQSVLSAAARSAAASPRARQAMAVAARSAAAREAQFSRIAELQETVAAAFAAHPATRRHRPPVLAATLLSLLSLTLRIWHAGGCRDMSRTLRQVLDTLSAALPPSD